MPPARNNKAIQVIPGRALENPAGVSGVVFNLMRYSVKDGPGLRTTVFLKGCPLRCRWCHNPESQESAPQLVFRARRCIGCGDCVTACPHGAITLSGNTLTTDQEACRTCGACALACPSQAREIIGRSMTAAEVIGEVKKDLPFYEESGGGVTFSGGEPLAQPDFLHALLSLAKAEGLNTAVDTCGAAPLQVVERIRPLVDLFLFDLKIMDETGHRNETGKGNRPILKNLLYLNQSQAEIIVRVPVIPGVTDQSKNALAIGAFVAKLEQIRYIELLPFHETGVEKYRLLGREAYPARAPHPSSPGLDDLVQILTGFGIEVKTGG